MIKLSCNVSHVMSLECNRRDKVFGQFLCSIWCDSKCHWPGFIRHNSVNPFDALFSQGYTSNDIYGQWKKQLYHKTICSKFAIHAWDKWMMICMYYIILWNVHFSYHWIIYYCLSNTKWREAKNNSFITWYLVMTCRSISEIDLYVWLSAPSILPYQMWYWFCRDVFFNRL